MIFTHIHEHRWWGTAEERHGSRVFQCFTCGDRAYGEGIKDHGKPFPSVRALPLTDNPGAIDYA